MSSYESTNGRWVWSQDHSPPMGGYGPLPVPAPPPHLVYQAPPPQGGWPGTRGRGQRGGPPGDGRGQNVVTRVKAQVGVARPGQVLETARFAAATLANRSPSLYGQFLAGLTGQGGEPVKAPPNEGKVAQSLIVADRKAKWQELCAEDQDVQFWQRCQKDVKARAGTNVAVDDLVAEDDAVDIRLYLKGKKRREELLAQVGLAREGSQLVPVRGKGDDSDSQVGSHEPASREAKQDPKDAREGELQQIISALGAITARLDRLETVRSQSLGSSQSSGSGGSGGDRRAPSPPVKT